MLPLKKKLLLVLIGLACSLTAALSINIVFARLPEAWDMTKSFDLYFYNIFFTPTLKPHPALMIIDRFDDRETGLRRDYASMINRLHEAGASVIALDVRFVNVDTIHDPAADQALVESVAACPQVHLAMDFAGPQPPTALMRDEMKRFALPYSVCEILIPKIVAENGVDLPFYRLLNAAQHLGHINSSTEYHHFPPVIPYGDSCYASLPLEIARSYWADSSARNGQISNSVEGAFDPKRIPLDNDGQVLVNFLALEKLEPKLYSWQGAWELLNSGADEFQNAVVLIVNSAGETLIPSPLGPYPRWALLASITNQFLSHHYIDTSILYLPAFYSIAICFVGMFLFLFVAPRMNKKWRKTRVVFVAGSVLFLLVIFLLLRSVQIWLGVMIPLLIYNSSMLAVRGMYYRMIRPPEYLEFSLNVLERTDEGYPLKILDAQGREEKGKLMLSPEALQEEKFQQALLRLKPVEVAEADMRAVGEKLFATIFQGEAFHRFENNLDQAERGRKNVRLRLHLDAPELVCLPWELLRSSDLPVGRFALNKHVSIVRHLSLTQPIRKLPFRAPLNILVLISAPMDPELPLLNVKSEMALIQKALLQLRWGGDVRLDFCEHVTLEKLQQELERRKPDVIHFIGHSRFDKKNNISFIELESETGERDSVSAEDFGTLLQNSPVRLVVLNSCESAAASANDAFAGIAHRLINVGVPAVVAMQFKILDNTATLFSEVFYSALITKFSIEAAITETRLQLLVRAREDLLGWATPVLFLRAKDGRIFELERA